MRPAVDAPPPSTALIPAQREFLQGRTWMFEDFDAGVGPATGDDQGVALSEILLPETVSSFSERDLHAAGSGGAVAQPDAAALLPDADEAVRFLSSLEFSLLDRRGGDGAVTRLSGSDVTVICEEDPAADCHDGDGGSGGVYSTPQLDPGGGNGGNWGGGSSGPGGGVDPNSGCTFSEEADLIADNGTDLNPRDMLLQNETTRAAFENFYNELLKIDSDFSLVITGGDRYFDENGNIRSSTNDGLIPGSSPNSLHLYGLGVDFSINGFGGSVSDIEATANATGFAEFVGGYSDGHLHVGVAETSQGLDDEDLVGDNSCG